MTSSTIPSRWAFLTLGANLLAKNANPSDFLEAFFGFLPCPDPDGAAEIRLRRDCNSHESSSNQNLGFSEQSRRALLPSLMKSHDLATECCPRYECISVLPMWVYSPAVVKHECQCCKQKRLSKGRCSLEMERDRRELVSRLLVRHFSPTCLWIRVR